MNNTLQSRCTLLADNRDTVHQGFKWENDLMSVVASVIFTGAGRTADVDRMKECRKILKENEGIFSDFRGNALMAVISKMALAADPQHYLDEITDVYRQLHQGKIFGSGYMVLAAMSLCDRHRADEAAVIVERTKELMKQMKKNHPFLTDDEDMAFAALMAMSSKSIEALVEDMEACYEILKQTFKFHSNAVQALSQILAVSEQPAEDKCAKVQQIFDALTERGAKYGKEYELASLGALVDIEVPVDTLADEIVEASEYLKTRKGFGNLIMGKKTRLMFAALMTAAVYAPENSTMSQSVISSSMAIVVAEQMALMVCLMVTASSSNNSSSTT